MPYLFLIHNYIQAYRAQRFEELRLASLDGSKWFATVWGHQYEMYKSKNRNYTYLRKEDAARLESYASKTELVHISILTLEKRQDATEEFRNGINDKMESQVTLYNGLANTVANANMTMRAYVRDLLKGVDLSKIPDYIGRIDDLTNIYQTAKNELAAWGREFDRMKSSNNSTVKSNKLETAELKNRVALLESKAQPEQGPNISSAEVKALEARIVELERSKSEPREPSAEQSNPLNGHEEIVAELKQGLAHQYRMPCLFIVESGYAPMYYSYRAAKNLSVPAAGEDRPEPGECLS
jgi:hypothetical protein